MQSREKAGMLLKIYCAPIHRMHKVQFRWRQLVCLHYVNVIGNRQMHFATTRIIRNPGMGIQLGMVIGC